MDKKKRSELDYVHSFRRPLSLHITPKTGTLPHHQYPTDRADPNKKLL
jgi:hypothetical protein